MPRWVLQVAVDTRGPSAASPALIKLLASELAFLDPRVEPGVVPVIALTVVADNPDMAVAYTEGRLHQILASAGITGTHYELVGVSQADADD